MVLLIGIRIKGLVGLGRLISSFMRGKTREGKPE